MKSLLILFLTTCPLLSLAQRSFTTSPAPASAKASGYEFTPRLRTADLSIATNGKFSSLALTVNQLHGLGRSHRFKIGYGLRFTATTANQLDYITAPAKLTSGEQSIIALFTENINDNLDTLQFTKTQVNSINLSIHLEYGVTRRLGAGINIDGVGYSFGSKQSGKFIANGPSRSPLTNSIQTARVTPLNLLLISDSDIGSLNSEAYIRYRITPALSVRGGIGFQFTEYTTDRLLTLENDRFRAKSTGVQVAIAYHF
jgi:hypothetical protein